MAACRFSFADPVTFRRGTRNNRTSSNLDRKEGVFVRILILVCLFPILAGCAGLSGSPNQAKQASGTNQKSGFTQAKTQQWFSPDTPETLPPDKIKKLSLGVGGFGGAY